MEPAHGKTETMQVPQTMILKEAAAAVQKLQMKRCPDEPPTFGGFLNNYSFLVCNELNHIKLDVELPERHLTFLILATSSWKTFNSAR